MENECVEMYIGYAILFIVTMFFSHIAKKFSEKNVELEKENLQLMLKLHLSGLLLEKEDEEEESEKDA